MDRRLTPANERIAHDKLRGVLESPNFTAGHELMCRVAVTDMVSVSGGARASQLILGDVFLCLEVVDGLAFGVAEKDGYCGYVRSDDLGTVSDATHWVRVPATHVYPEPNMKSLAKSSVYFGSEVAVRDISGSWANLADGTYMPAQHVLPLDQRMNDPVEAASLYLGTPYLWGGSSRFGIDCSGLVQSALRACGRDCPRDSDMQEAELGQSLPLDTLPVRGDLIFWKGHVGIMADSDRLLHANAGYMSTVFELYSDAVARIEAAGDGLPTAIKRLT